MMLALALAPGCGGRAPAQPPVTATATGKGHIILDRRFDFAPGDDPSSVEIIEPVAAAALMKREPSLLIDVRGPHRFEELHAAGAINVPLLEVSARAPSLPRPRTVIAYCTCPAEDSSIRAALQLRRLGFPHAVAIRGGLDGWRKAGLPVKSGTE